MNFVMAELLRIFMYNTYVIKKAVLFSSAILFLFTPLLVYAGEKSPRIPHAANMALFKAHKLLIKKDPAGALNILESFQTKQPKGMKPGDADPRGYQHYYINFTLGNCCLELADSSKLPAQGEKENSCTIKSNYIQKAVSHYKASITVKPNFSPAWLNLAKSYYDLEDYKKAGGCFLRSFETSEEKRPETLYYGAVSFMAADENKKSLEIFEQLISLYKDEIKLEWKETLAQLYLSCDLPLKALPYIEELAEKLSTKKKKQWQEILLYQYITLGMKSKAMAYAKRLTKEDPVEPKWWKGLAHIYFSEERYKDALVPFTICSYFAFLSDQEKKLLADLNLSLGIPVQAMRYYEDLLAKKEDSDIYKRLIHAYLSLHKPEKAIETIEMALKYSSQEGLRMLKGWILYENERYKEAMQAFENAAKQMSDPGQAWLMTGYAAWNSNDLSKARKAFAKALKYPKQKNKARESLRRVERIMVNVDNL